MNILLLADRFPYPLTNGQNLRLYNLLREVSQRHEIDMVCFGPAAAGEDISRHLRRVETFPVPEAAPAGGVRRLVHALSPARMQAFSAQLLAHVEQVITEREYDLVWIVGWAMAPSLPRRFPAPVVVDVIDDGVIEYWREFRNARGIGRKLRMLKRLAVIYLFERRYFCPADRCVAVSEVDARWLSRVCRRSGVDVVHNGVDTDHYAPAQGEQRDNRLVFEGMIGFRPNTDGILFFCREVLPLIHARRPDIELEIVGKEPPEAVRELARDPRITVTGYVDDVRPHVDRATLFVCPLRIGAGIKNKVLQAWAMGKATVATPASLGGLDARDGENVLVGRDAGELADAVLRLVADRPMRRKLGEAARRTVIERYSWKSKAMDLENIFQEVRKRRGGD